jgi:hypothetical protein
MRKQGWKVRQKFDYYPTILAEVTIYPVRFTALFWLVSRPLLVLDQIELLPLQIFHNNKNLALSIFEPARVTFDLDRKIRVDPFKIPRLGNEIKRKPIFVHFVTEPVLCILKAFTLTGPCGSPRLDAS